MLLYLIEHSCPDIANSGCELSTILIGAYSAAFKEMLHVIKFVSDMKNYGLKFVPNLDKNGIWDLICYSNNDYAGNPDSH